MNWPPAAFKRCKLFLTSRIGRAVLGLNTGVRGSVKPPGGRQSSNSHGFPIGPTIRR